MCRALFLLISFVTVASASDWPQWRGPFRNGVAVDSRPLIDKIPESGLKELWESEPIPADENGGLSSPVVAGGKVFVAVVWHRQVPTETRQIDEKVLLQLGFQDTSSLSAELLKKIEDTRGELPPNLRGKKLEEFAQKFADTNFDEKQKQLYSAWLAQRFQKGKLAVPLTTLDALHKRKDHVFANETEMKQWLDEQGWAEAIKGQIVAAVSPTKTVADDSVVCLDLNNGKTLWRTTRPGAPIGFDGSSTPSVVGDRIYALASQRIWCLNVSDGSIVWETSLENERRGLGSSPLVLDNIVVVNIGRPTAFDANTGKKLWEQEKAGGLHASPVAWSSSDRKLILINGKNLSALDPKTGAIVWSVPAGGDSTPAIDGNLLVVQSFNNEVGLVAYRLAPDKADQVWNHPYPPDTLRTQSSAVIYGDRVFLMDDNRLYCVDARSGGKIWSAAPQSTIISPVIADKKLFALANNGNTLLMVAADRDDYRELGRSTIRSIWVPSPCIAHGKLVLRMKNSVKAWDLAR